MPMAPGKAAIRMPMTEGVRLSGKRWMARAERILLIPAGRIAEEFPCSIIQPIEWRKERSKLTWDTESFDGRGEVRVLSIGVNSVCTHSFLMCRYAPQFIEPAPGKVAQVLPREPCPAHAMDTGTGGIGLADARAVPAMKRSW